MKATFFALVAAAIALPVLATPVPPRLATDNGLMVEVPNIGSSRIETVNFCVKDAGVDKYQDLTTDSEFETFERCLREMT